ncbi:MAG: hypothetical protein DDT29_00645 [Dehalococcoidia bacterium]|nr:hypothetical protein [Bacillota bacterium]
MKKARSTSQQSDNIRYIDREDTYYPPALRRHLSDHAPKNINTLGNLALLRQKPLAFLCSVKCPGNLILQTYDLAQNLRRSGVTIIGGFHSPMEQECLKVLLRGANPLIICPARALENMRIGRDYTKPLERGRLLFLSPFITKPRRPTLETVQYRNQFVAVLAEKVFVAYAEPRGKMEQLSREILSWGKLLYTFNEEANRNLIELGAKPVTSAQASQLV